MSPRAHRDSRTRASQSDTRIDNGSAPSTLRQPGRCRLYIPGRYDGCSKSMDELVGIMSRGSADPRSPGPSNSPQSGLFEYRPVRFSPEGGCFARNHFKRSVSARFIAYEASSHRTSPRGSSWVQALPGKFRGNHNPGFDRGNFCPFPGAYLGSHTPGIPGISGSTWEHTHPGAYSGRETRVFPGGRWEPRSQPRSCNTPRCVPGTEPPFSRPGAFREFSISWGQGPTKALSVVPGSVPGSVPTSCKRGVAFRLSLKTGFRSGFSTKGVAFRVLKTLIQTKIVACSADADTPDPSSSSSRPTGGGSQGTQSPHCFARGLSAR